MDTEIEIQPVESNLKAAIQRTVEERFEGKRVVAVEVTRDRDPDGEAIFTVKAILENTANLQALGGGKLLGLVRHLRLALEKEGNYAFPLVRMMTKRDAEILVNES